MQRRCRAGEQIEEGVDGLGLKRRSRAGVVLDAVSARAEPGQQQLDRAPRA
ncbi:hypothetical protein [Salipiger pallidus]|uniref:hypothetical protein n=1 Tax=Salipiger pallidus TaxID=1775170 RepID=UPI00166E3C63|nr:hypothetical protein [Salipiger pallidus]